MLGTVLISGLLLVSSQTQQQATGGAQSVQRFRFAEVHMGVPFRISVYARQEQAANKAARAAFERIAELDRVFSDYDSKSEISLLRAAKAGQPVPISADLAHLLRQSVSYSRATDGAFDVTVGPLVRLWRRARRRQELPEPELLAAALARSGFDKLQVQDRHVTFSAAGMRLDFGAIAKGYACDEAIRVLKEHKLPVALVDGGGDIAVGDPPAGKAGWRIEIEPAQAEAPATTLLLRNQAVATSGDRYRFVEIDGKRYSHIVNPKTGMGLTSRMTVTVVARDAMTADACASAVSVMGRQAGIRFVNSREGVEVLITELTETADGPVEKTAASCGFRDLGAGRQAR